MTTARWRILLLAALALALLALPTAAGAQTPADQLAALAARVDGAIARLEAGDVAGARAEYAAFEDGWFEIEDGIRAQSRASYRALEGAISDATQALTAEPIQADLARAALVRLRQQSDAFIGGAAPAEQPVAASAEAVTLPALVARLDRAQAELAGGDAAAAAAEVDGFRRDWTEVEEQVKPRSARAYADTENNMAQASALLSQRPPDVAGAQAVLARMRADLAPLAEAAPAYGAFDAAIILLREGLEALLVVAALVAFLKKIGRGDKARWIWTGSGAGVLASVAMALIVNVVFAQATAGANRELLEGVTGLFAAAMLIYVSFWLHAKASLGAWQRYIREQSTAALAKNSLLSLALIAFLAVFREGAETVLFYIGIAPSISTADLLLGLGAGAASLAVVGVLIIAFGLRIPIRPFFLGTSVLVYYLAFKFTGVGVNALQVAGYLSATPKPFLPSSDLVGLFPTIETTAVQAILLVLGLAVLLVPHLPRRLTRATAA